MRLWLALVNVLMNAGLTLGLALLLAACAAQGTPAPADLSASRLTPGQASLADRFARIAFSDELGTAHPLQRWAKPPRLIFWEGAERLAPFAPDIYAATVDLAGATGRPFTAEGEPSFFVIHDDGQGIANQLSALPLRGDAFVLPGDCFAITWVNPESEIEAAVVFIRAEMPDAGIPSCIVQEFAQAMGLYADLDHAGGTVFDSYATLTRLAEDDKRLLGLLYDPRLRPGMTPAEALPIVDAIIAENGW